LQTPAIRDAFSLESEPDAVRASYGRTKIGGRCLMARRLVEAGARFVMVDYGYDPDYGNVWDNHNAPTQNHPPIQKMCFRGYHLAGMDRAFAALLSDLRERGLLDSTLVVFLTEFGRTPQINPAGGRDHWGAAGSLFFAGAGVRGGQVIGATDDHAAQPTTHPYSPADIAATVYAVLGIDHKSFVPDIMNRPRPILEHGEPIRELWG
jgi:arylsulfatase A-like enzyme